MIQANARTLPPSTRSADNAEPKVEGLARKVRVRRYDTSGTYTELSVDCDSMAARLAARNQDMTWRPVPGVVKIRNPGGVIHWVHEDHPAVAVAKSKKPNGWALVTDDEVNAPPSEPPLEPCTWLLHPNGRVVRVPNSSIDVRDAIAGLGKMKLASPQQVARRELLGPTYNWKADDKEY